MDLSYHLQIVLILHTQVVNRLIEAENLTRIYQNFELIKI